MDDKKTLDQTTQNEQPADLNAKDERARLAATAQVLNAIADSKDNVQPAADLISMLAKDLCGAVFAGVVLAGTGGGSSRLIASSGLHPDVQEIWANGAFVSEPGKSIVGQAVSNGALLHVIDIDEAPFGALEDGGFRKMVDLHGCRSVVFVPMISGGGAIGCLILGREEAAPFADIDVALLETLAAQAVIATDTVEQFKEGQTRQAREAATQKVLAIISQSREDEAPVFDAILNLARQLCEAELSFLLLVNSDRTALNYIVASGKQLGTFDSGRAIPMDDPMGVSTAARTGRVVHNPDLKDDQLYRDGHPTRVKLVDEEGVRAQLAVPLFQQGQAIGVIALNRRAPKPFAPDEIALVEAFAAQAVIAIENARQFRELNARLARETATRDVLSVISRSRENEGPVFQTILRNMARLCATDLATLSLLNDAKTHLEYAAHYGDELHTYKVGVDRWSVNGSLQIAESVREVRVIHNVDLKLTDHYINGDPWRRQLVDKEGVRSFLTVPLLSSDGQPVGVIGIYRREVRAFSDDEIALVEAFAAQAVIALDNSRQLRELNLRLTREEATSDVLSVISQSRDDEAPVFEKVLEQAKKVCNADQAGLFLLTPDGQRVVLVANYGHEATSYDIGAEFPADGMLSAAVAIREGQVVHNEDFKQSEAYAAANPIARKMVDVEGIRSRLTVP
ncbi:MAG: GAF domain-containing protein, partial [Arenibacterium sp.]